MYFSKHISNRRKTKDNMGLLQVEERWQEKMQRRQTYWMLSFASIFTDKIIPQKTLTQETRVKETWKTDRL